MDDDCFVPAQLGLDFGPALRLLAAHGCERAVYETGGVGLDCHAPIIRLVGWAGNGTLGLVEVTGLYAAVLLLYRAFCFRAPDCVGFVFAPLGATNALLYCPRRLKFWVSGLAPYFAYFYKIVEV